MVQAGMMRHESVLHLIIWPIFNDTYYKCCACLLVIYNITELCAKW